MANNSQAVTDVTEAREMGLDGFALNVQCPDAEWARNTIDLLFTAVSQQRSNDNDAFGLFFSMDMNVVQSPKDFLPLYKKYASHEGYYTYQGNPVLSTFRGGTHDFGHATPNEGWQIELKDALKNDPDITVNMKTPFFIPNFDDWKGCINSPLDADFHRDHPVVDGVFAWETAWSISSDNPPRDLTADDITQLTARDEANLAAAREAKKAYMMPISSYQNKHLDQSQNWYRPGGLTLPTRLADALRLKPDFVQLLTWNDAGEGHYFGNTWPEAIAGCTPIVDLIDGYDHSGWRALIAPFITALKQNVTDPGKVYPPFGKAVTGAFWYRPLLRDSDCSADTFGLEKPCGWHDAQDVISVAVLLPPSLPGEGSYDDSSSTCSESSSPSCRFTIRVFSGDKLIDSFKGEPGLNMKDVKGVRKGKQRVEVVFEEPSGGPNITLGSGTGLKDVTDDIKDLGGICNFNYQVVEIA